MQYVVARSSHGWAATAESWTATRCAAAAVIAVICNEELDGAERCHHGPEPAVRLSGNTNGRPPSTSEIDSSQSHNATACEFVVGAISSSSSNAWCAAAGWLSGDRRSGSRPHP